MLARARRASSGVAMPFMPTLCVPALMTAVLFRARKANWGAETPFTLTIDSALAVMLSF